MSQPAGLAAERSKGLLRKEAVASTSDFEVVRAVLSAEPISVDQAIAAVGGDEAGAIVSFSGVVRNHDGGKAVDRLGYSAHPTAQGIMSDVVSELITEHSGGTPQRVRIWAAHRTGMLHIGDPALVCAVAAEHRGQAFALCSELVDRIKERVPIWKEQFFSDGTVEWVGTETTD